MGLRIFLCGMPGSGKTTAGRKLAYFLNLRFYDLDEIIEKEKKMKIDEIFKKFGEKRFREFEYEIFKRIKNEENCVISLGGGAVLNEKILEFINRGENYAFYIDTEIEEIKRRIKNSFLRPVLENFEDVENLYNKRKGIYRKIKFQVDGRRPPREVALQILSGIDLDLNRKVCERPHKFYIGNIKNFFEDIKRKKSRVFVITHEKIKNLISYFYDLSEFETICVPEGEGAKSLEYAEKIFKILIDKKADRNSIILGIGGGVIGDLTGFISSVYMRGMRLFLIPTTLLSAVDAHLGGKNAVNFIAKNIIGTFKFPEITFCDPRIFVTLKKEHIIDGFAEIFKTALFDEKIYKRFKKDLDKILNPDLKTYLKWVPVTGRLKLKIVKKDPFELKGERMLLNLGHTAGHAIEAGLNYRISHGKAVLLGLKEEIEISKNMGIIDKEFCKEFKGLFERVRNFLPDYKKGNLKKFIFMDKKKKGEKIKIFLIKSPGKFEFKKIDLKNLPLL